MSPKHGHSRSFSAREIHHNLPGIRAGAGSPQRGVVVPGHPLRRIPRQFAGVPLQLGEIVEWVGVTELAGMDQTHVQIAYLGAVQRLVKQRVLAMQNRFLERSLTQIMPIARLCRVNWLQEAPDCFRMTVGAA